MVGWERIVVDAGTVVVGWDLMVVTVLTGKVGGMISPGNADAGRGDGASTTPTATTVATRTAAAAARGHRRSPGLDSVSTADYFGTTAQQLDEMCQNTLEVVT